MNNLWCTNYSSVRTKTRFTVIMMSVCILLSADRARSGMKEISCVSQERDERNPC